MGLGGVGPTVCITVYTIFFEHFACREDIINLGLDEVLIQVKSESSDRDAWNMADHGLMMLRNIGAAVHKRDSLVEGKDGPPKIEDLPTKKNV